MELQAGHHKIVEYFGMTFHMDTIYMTWLVMAIVIILMWLATRKRELIPSGIQNAMEMILEALEDQMKPSLGKYWKHVSSILFTYFLFILFSNELGLLPNPDHILASPTNDLNTTLGLALASTVIVWILGVKAKGVSYFKHYVKPFAPFIIINLMEEVAKPVTLAFRLFGNILAGEILLEILYELVPYGAPIIWLLFSLVVGIIQAFIFAILVTSYLGMSVSEESH